MRELGWTSVLEVNYTGSKGTHLLVPITGLTYLYPQYWSMGRKALQQDLAPNPFYGVITDPRSQLSKPTVQRYKLLRAMPQFDGASGAEQSNGDSAYNALQIKVEKRYSKGVSFLAHYTWAKLLDDSSVTSGNTTWLGGSSSFQNPFDLSMEKSLSSNDIAHRFVVSGAWELPFGRGRAFGNSMTRLLDAFVGGWEISGVYTAQTGMPLQVLQSGGTLWNGTQRPNLIGDPSTSGSVQDRLTSGWFNPDAFSRPAADTFGSASRYLNYRGPAITAFNAALLKSWHITESQRAEFRLEAENALNHPIFSDPNTSNSASSHTAARASAPSPVRRSATATYYF